MTVTRASSVASVLAGLGLLVAGVVAPSEASAAWTTIPSDAANLPRGATTHVPYIMGSSLHTGKGGTIELPAEDEQGYDADYQLLGNSPRGWVVVFGPSHPTLVRVTADGEVTVFHTPYLPPPNDEFEHNTYSWRLSDDRTRVLETLNSPDEATITNVIDLDGRLVDSLPIGYTDVLDFSGPVAIISYGYRAVRWRIGSKPTKLPRNPNFVDLGRGTQAVELDGPWRYGFARLATPRRVRWAAAFQPLRTSPNGRLVYGTKLSRIGTMLPGIAQVRRVSDGKVVAEFRGQDLARQLRRGQWEGSRAILIQRPSSRHQRYGLVRCTVAGRCSRASAFGGGYFPVSFPPFP